MTRILIVEDDSALAEMLVEFFNSSGFQTFVAPNGSRALQYIETRKPDAIVLDLMLPVMNGVELARRLRLSPDTRDIPILAITAVDGSNELFDVLMVDAVVTKPFDLEEIERQLVSMIAERQSLATDNPHALSDSGTTPSDD